MRLTELTILVVFCISVVGCGSSEERPDERVIFVRGGILVPTSEADCLLTVTADGADASVPGNAFPGGRTLFRFSWTPGTAYCLKVSSKPGEVLLERTMTAPLRPEPATVATVLLENVHAGRVTSGGEPDASVVFSADGSLVALGTFGGYARAFDVRTGSMVFEKRLPGAVIKRVAISSDNLRVYVGEMSYDGYVRAFELKSGKELWNFCLADELEHSKPARPDDLFGLYSYPQVYGMRVVDDDLVVIGFHSWQDGSTPKHRSRVYRFDGRSGRAKWKFPAGNPLPRNISSLDVRGGLLALSAYQWEPAGPGDSVPQAAVHVLDVATGKPLARHVFEPLKPFFKAVPMWYGLAFDDSGHLVVGLMDGRAVVFDAKRKPGLPGVNLKVVRKMDLATPVEVTSVPIYAGVGWAAGEGGTLYALTDGRLVVSSAAARGKSVKADHPASNTIFAIDGGSGKELWRWKLTTTAQSLAIGGGTLAASTQQSFSPDDPLDYGLTVFDVNRPGRPLDKFLFRYHTAGPIVALSVSPDGRTIAAVEAPVRLPDGLTVVGKYRLHLVR